MSHLSEKNQEEAESNQMGRGEQYHYPASAPNLPTGWERDERKKPNPSAKEIRRGERKQERDLNKILENGMQTDEVIAFSPQPSVWEGEEATSTEPQTILANEATGHTRQGQG